MWKRFLLIPAISAVFAFPASAGEKTATQPVAVNGIYFEAEGFYEHVELPSYRLGLADDGGNFSLLFKPLQLFQPDLEDGGVRGAVGFVLPGGNTRIEFGGSYLSASTRETQVTSQNFDVAAVPLTGGVGAPGAFNCSAPNFVCTVAGGLETAYRSYQINGKIRTDGKYGAVTVKPSLTVLHSNKHVEQVLSQSFELRNLAGALLQFGDYAASTSLDWRDLGASAGLDVNVLIAPAFSIEIGGSVGVTARRVSLTGADTASDGAGGVFIAGTSLSLHDRKTALQANAEARLIYQLTRMTGLRGFAGLNYDRDVPGISSPTALPQAAAGIIYSGQTNYYAGGGLMMKFGGAAAAR